MTLNSTPDPARLAPFLDCMDTYGMEGRNPDSPWPWNIIATDAIGLSCGRLTRAPSPVAIDPIEYDLCQRLAGKSADFFTGVYWSTEADYPMSAYFVVAESGVASAHIDESLIRKAFGGTIYPHAEISIEPLAQRFEYLADEEFNGADFTKSWKAYFTWMNKQDFVDTAFVRTHIDQSAEWDRQGEDRYNGGCVTPMLLIGLTPSGSLIGVVTVEVNT